MTLTEKAINKISQDKIDFNLGVKLLLEDKAFNFDELFATLRDYIFNSIPNKTDYNSETYQNAISTIPLKSTYTTIAILQTYPPKIALNKLVELPKSEREKTIISLVWIFKITDTERRNTECKNGCEHYWHNLD
ncbi:hypothetical protein EOD40_08690 [Flavobacterium sufflavum]|uniref:Uncharacterized protein n=1 Tax=Flavobacterium sufflavum TaxID=1921138 RepID=A0A3S2V4R4_9FLAO|nr:DUF5958 family protein [Flavobacterium sufflavum]RVT76571.1 hypothetical protein EOD40_08690 [Flavobacterium sufflavum]